MEYVSLLFWLLLAVPGFAALRRLDRTLLDAGPLAVFGLSFLATCVLLSPVSIVCYIMSWPLWVFTSTCVVLVAAGAVDLLLRKCGRELLRLLTGTVCIAGALLLADLVCSARAGAILYGDALVHLARIRQLLDHGFSNVDPFLGGSHFWHYYHTNLFHALFAACAAITPTDYLGAWHASLPLAKLLIAGGISYLAWCVFERQWVAWVAAVFFLFSQAPVTFLIYPNKLAPYWIIPTLIGFTVSACRGPCRWQAPVMIAGAMLVLGQWHGLYVLYAGLLLGPLLVTAAVARLVRRRPGRWCHAACVAALLVGLPFPLVSRIGTAVHQRVSRKLLHPDTRFQPVGPWVMKAPWRGFGSYHGIRYALLGSGLLAMALARRRREALCLAMPLVVGAAVFFVPPLCTLLLRAVGAPWILLRLSFIFPVLFVVVVPATIALFLANWIRSRWWRGLATVVFAGAGVIYAEPKLLFGVSSDQRSRLHDWHSYLEKTAQPRAERRKQLGECRARHAFLSAHIEPGTTILVNRVFSLRLVALCDCHVVAPLQGTGYVPDIERRKADVRKMLAADTPWAVRRRLLARYDIRYVLASAQMRWAYEHGRTVASSRRPRQDVVVLDLGPEPTQMGRSKPPRDPPRQHPRRRQQPARPPRVRRPPGAGG